jgi:hypothetical protein
MKVPNTHASMHGDGARPPGRGIRRFLRGKRTWKLLTACLAAVLVTGIAMPAALAVHDTGAFELDGNATNGPAPGDDWDNVCHQVTGSDCSTTNDTTGATAVDWAAEPNVNTTIFTGGGSKDPNDVSQWAWNDGGGGLPAKDNLLHSFAARYPSTSEGDVLYFGSDRLDNSGDAQQGFWFFQNSISLNGTGASGTFNGVHKNGDLLLVSDFSNGGTTSTITVYKWNTACTKAGQVLADGNTCGDANLEQLATSNAANCATANANDTFCGLVNANKITMPWSFTDKSGTPNNGALNGEFYEGGINLTKLGLSSECFASVASETRSSTSTTATLKDFILGSFGSCGSKTVTTPQLGDGTAIPAGGVSVGTGASVKVQDQAVVSLPNQPSTNPTGTVSFHLCGPTPLSDANYTLCATGGTSIGSAKTLSGTSNPATVTSDQATVTSAGRYCWRADYSGDPARSITGSSDSSVSECFKVLPVQPTLTTQAGTSPVDLGKPVTDTATLTGTANKPGTPVINPTTAGGPAGGSITFTLLGPNDCTTVAFTSDPVSVSGDGTYPTTGSVSFTPTKPGTYHWAASYTGDAPNTLSADHNTSCSDTNEDVVVNQAQTSISTAQKWLPNDSATLSAATGGNLSGNVRFQLFDNSTCTGTALYDSGSVAVSGASPQTVDSSNTNVLTSSGTVSWLVTYTSSNPAQTDATSSCNTENSSLTITNGGP